MNGRNDDNDKEEISFLAVGKFLLILFFQMLSSLIPRFITEYVAVDFIEGKEGKIDSLEIVCAMEDVGEWEEFFGVLKVRSLCWIGMGFFPKQLGDVILWDDFVGGKR